MCFKGPLGAHLKVEVREKIWTGEYVEIFSLLPKPDESKKEEEERRRYSLIPRTFSNWLQAFVILVSLIGKKALENFYVLFCYLDSIGRLTGSMGVMPGFGMTNNLVNERLCAPPSCGISAFG